MPVTASPPTSTASSAAASPADAQRRRRARIGTTVASLAVIGVVGGLAVVVPRLGEADSARDPGIASDGPTATAVEPPTPEPTETPTGAPARLRDIPAAQVPAVALSLLDPPTSMELGEPDVHVDKPETGS